MIFKNIYLATSTIMTLCIIYFQLLSQSCDTECVHGLCA